MFKILKKIKSYGVFNSFINTDEISDFKEKNIIYGWNYSGKTTLSRIFSSIEHRCHHEDYLDGEYEIELDDGTVVSNSSMDKIDVSVRVFNSEFIDNNLKWDGSNFNPILLLGEGNIQASDNIKSNKEKIERCDKGYKSKDKSYKKTSKHISDCKKEYAKKIKHKLNLVDAYTATHLNNDIETVRIKPLNESVLDDDKKNRLIKIARSQESDKLEIVENISVKINAKQYFNKANALIEKTPEFNKVIEYLRNNPEVSSWVEKGLEINKNKEDCEFCGNEISQDRFEELKMHFSKDFVNYKSDLKKVMEEVESLKLIEIEDISNKVYSEYQESIRELKDKVLLEIKEYDNQISGLVEELRKKIENPFMTLEVNSYNPVYENNIVSLISEINSLINKSNEKTNNFSSEKQSALINIRLHYAAKFVIDYDLSLNELLIGLYEKHKEKYLSIRHNLEQRNLALEASISDAQKGRERLNDYISKFLGRDEVRIEVVKDGEGERFRLVRESKPAKNLSEGEKSAIAFSYYLTKLEEEEHFNETVVYIDDPISSLDSNHIFQVNSLIQNFFFSKVPQQGNESNFEWKLNCLQIFISTHNFEFFTLIKELPIANKKRNGLYQVKRVGTKTSTILDLPKSIEQYSSEYHYLFSILYKFHISDDKSELEILLAIPNSVRRFVELYTFSRIPGHSKETVDSRAERLFGSQKSKRILKVLHYFSHSNNIQRISQNSDLICDIENAVNELMELLQKDTMHYSALIESLD